MLTDGVLKTFITQLNTPSDFWKLFGKKYVVATYQIKLLVPLLYFRDNFFRFLCVL